MDAERLREGLDDLIKLADYLVCAAQFPQASELFSLEVFVFIRNNIIFEFSHHSSRYNFSDTNGT